MSRKVATYETPGIHLESPYDTPLYNPLHIPFQEFRLQTLNPMGLAKVRGLRFSGFRGCKLMGVVLSALNLVASKS